MNRGEDRSLLRSEGRTILEVPRLFRFRFATSSPTRRAARSRRLPRARARHCSTSEATRSSLRRACVAAGDFTTHFFLRCKREQRADALARWPRSECASARQTRRFGRLRAAQSGFGCMRRTLRRREVRFGEVTSDASCRRSRRRVCRRPYRTEGQKPKHDLDVRLHRGRHVFEVADHENRVSFAHKALRHLLSTGVVPLFRTAHVVQLRRANVDEAAAFVARPRAAAARIAPTLE